MKGKNETEKERVHSWAGYTQKYRRAKEKRGGEWREGEEERLRKKGVKRVGDEKIFATCQREMPHWPTLLEKVTGNKMFPKQFFCEDFIG